ncbi:MAG: aldo/keto reductase [Oscillospiraceae bacterium]|jgi:diketogulonate reductase-like aldo/keto reductase|nr:aldo/keto reductase [Oscillospiraceae bacterium]
MNNPLFPRIGQGTWRLGDEPSLAAAECAALRRGIKLGATLIDTAEMYGDGRSEALVGRALQGVARRDVQICSKVYPWNADRAHIFTSCADSLRRLGTDYLDLYLLHWPGDVPLVETVACLEELVAQGQIRHWGVSNFDTADMQALWRVPGGQHCIINQVLYHLGSRGIEWDLLPWCRAQGVHVMAYSPLAEGGKLRPYGRNLLSDPLLCRLAEEIGCTVHQLLLAFVLQQPGVTAIPKSANATHTESNVRAADIAVTDAQWAQIDTVFCPPTSKMHLDIN